MKDDTPAPKLKRGFAAMDPERQRQIARLGGLNVPADRRSFAQSPELAASAGSIGGRRSQKRLKQED